MLRHRNTFYSQISRILKCIVLIGGYFIITASQIDTVKKIIYEYKISGLENLADISKNFDNISYLNKYKNSDIFSIFIIKKRIKQDLKILQKILDSYGFYDAKIDYKMITSPHKQNIHFNVQTGTRYKLNKFQIKFKKELHLKNSLLYSTKDLENSLKQGIDASEILYVFKKIVTNMGDNGYPLAEITNHYLILNKKNKIANLILEIDPKNYTVFGPTNIKAQNFISNKYIMNRIPWKKGAEFCNAKINKLYKRLSNLNIFSKVIIQSSTKTSPKKQTIETPVNINVKKGEQRTIHGALYFISTEGLGIGGGWEHRNITKQADSLAIFSDLSKQSQLIGSTYTYPDFLKINQKAVTKVKYEIEKDTNTASKFSFSLQKKIRKHLHFSYGIANSNEKITAKNYLANVNSIDFPVELNYDNRDNKINSSQGYNIIISTTPAFGKIGTNNYLLTNKMYFATYISHDEDKNYVFATWCSFNFILGSKFDQIPLTRKIYSGGDGQLRGYKRKSVGFIGKNNINIGAQSLLSGGIEERISINSNWGVVVFYEAAIIGKKVFPKTTPNIFHSVGCGARYNTLIGPIRADIALPLHKRKKTIDKNLHFYVSVGQSF